MAEHKLVFGGRYLTDLRALPVFDRARIQAAVTASLATEPDRANRHRRPLRAASWCPEATWQLRIGDFRVLYRLDQNTVEVLRVRFKARRSTEEMGP